MQSGLDDVTKVYARRGNETIALDRVSFAVEPGTVLGLLGPNGAGKTTALHSMLGLIDVTQGRVILFGEQVTAKNRSQLMLQVGAVTERPAFEPKWSAVRNLEALMRLVPDTGVNPQEVLDEVGLEITDSRQVGDFSHGMRQRLALAAALLKRPRLVILDEPTKGLDPVGVSDFRALVRRLARDGGVSVVLSSHLLDEMDRICDSVAILDTGALRLKGEIGDLRRAGPDEVHVVVSDHPEAMRILEGAKIDVREIGGGTLVVSEGEPDRVGNMLDHLGPSLRVEARAPSLETIYRRHVGRTSREGPYGD